MYGAARTGVQFDAARAGRRLAVLPDATGGDHRPWVTTTIGAPLIVIYGHDLGWRWSTGYPAKRDK
jgi:hypothetical protein